MKKDNPFISQLILLLVASSWGMNNVMMKIGFKGIDPILFGAIRLAVAMPFTLLLARFYPGYRPFTRRDLLSISGIALIGFTGFQVCFPLGVSLSSVPVGGILMATMPVWVVIIHLITRVEHISVKVIAGVLLTVAGIVLMSFSSLKLESDGSTLIGMLLIITAELFFAVNTVFLRPFLRKYSVPQVTAVAIVISLFVYMVLIPSRLEGFSFSAISLAGWGTIFYSGLIAMLLANILWNRTVTHLGSTRVSVFANLPPVFTMIFSSFILGEQMQGVQYAASALIACGVFLVQLKGKNESEQNKKWIQKESRENCRKSLI